MADGQGGQQFGGAIEECIGGDDERTRSLLKQRSDGDI